MGNNSQYFYISGFISLSLFFSFFLVFIYALFSVKDLNSFALKKDTYISISLDIPLVQKTKSEKKAETLPIESVSEKPSENIDVNDLFSDIWTKKIVKKEKKPVNSKRIEEIQKKIKKAEANDVKPIADKVNKQNESEANKETHSASTANEVNEYLAKIQAIVYQYFNVPANSEGNMVTAVIELNALGKVIDFRILRYSQHDALNEEVDKIKERLKNIIFPKNPENKSIKAVVKLISEE